MDETLDEWVQANLRYLTEQCGSNLPWTDANTTEEE